MRNPMEPYLYDRQGNPIKWDRYVQLRYEDPDYWNVAQDHVGAYHVSTVWLGLDHRLGNSERPVIFETMVFLNSATKDIAGMDMGCWRYSTEQEAIEGHKATCLLIEATVGVDVVDQAEDAQENSRDE